MSALAHALPPEAHLTRAAKWHVTLVFLGAVPISQVTAALDRVEPPPPFSLRLTGTGEFGKIAWAGVTGDVGPLTDLRERVHRSLTAATLLSDNRPYRPHLTVSYRGNSAIHKALANYAGTPWPVTEFALFNSHNGEYEMLQTWPLPPRLTHHPRPR